LRAEPKEDRWLEALIAIETDEARGKAQTGSVEDWATESLLAAREAYQDPKTDERMKPGAKPADDYQACSLAGYSRLITSQAVNAHAYADELRER
jgi:hypothetical protein